jgi:hypothetical protein
VAHVILFSLVESVVIGILAAPWAEQIASDQDDDDQYCKRGQDDPPIHQASDISVSVIWNLA